MDTLDSYLFVKRFIAHATDGEMHPEEWHRICTDLATHTHSLGLDLAHWEDALDRSVHDYHAILRERGPAGVVATFRQALSDLNRRFHHQPEVLDTLLAEMHDLAHADGRLHDMEVHFLAEASRAWQRKASV